MVSRSHMIAPLYALQLFHLCTLELLTPTGCALDRGFEHPLKIAIIIEMNNRDFQRAATVINMIVRNQAQRRRDLQISSTSSLSSIPSRPHLKGINETLDEYAIINLFALTGLIIDTELSLRQLAIRVTVYHFNPKTCRGI